jgi:hypothetical protein
VVLDVITGPGTGPKGVAAYMPYSGSLALGTVSDHAGRRRIGLADVDRRRRDELILDPQTSALLGEQQTIAQPAQGLAVRSAP